MGLVLRILGTWALGLALVLAVIDGTKSLAENAFVFTSVRDLWVWLAPGNWAVVEAKIGTWPLFAAQGAQMALGWPGWAVAGGLGIFLLFLGRRPRRPGYVTMR